MTFILDLALESAYLAKANMATSRSQFFNNVYFSMTTQTNIQTQDNCNVILLNNIFSFELHDQY